MADIFLSYTSSDREWAHWIAKELQGLGHSAHVHEWEIEHGADIYAWMEARHNAADHVLCVVSDEYRNGPYSRLERNAALWQAASKRPGFVLQVVVKPCLFPTLSDHFRRCELHGVPEETARVRLREFMAKRDVPETTIFPGTMLAVSNIRIRVPIHFMGREHALADIQAAMERGNGPVALHGLRGVGKTVLAAPMRSAIGATTARLGGYGPIPRGVCVPTWSASACGSAGSVPMTRKSRRWPRL